jgi:hypothetical protein
VLLLLPILLPLGLFLPGYFAARLFGLRLWAPSAFVLSLPLLFHCVFWLGVAGVPIKVWSVAPLLIAATGALKWAQRKFAPPEKVEKKTPWTGEERILLAACGVVGLILLVHSARTPLAGEDTRFRWDFLAQLIGQAGNFNFYPPLKPADFRSYFFVDGIPPLVSFTHWWLYASAGDYLPSLISVRVAAEFFGTLAFTYGATSALFSRRAGVLAAAALAASPLYFRAVFLGQETGLTALAVAAMLYFIVSARQPVAAGLAAAVCALSREYGWIALVGGVIALAWRRESRRQMVVFAGVAVAAGAPWYVRNWIVAGNPIYSLRLLGFAVNPVHDAFLQFYKSQLGVQTWTASVWVRVFLLLCQLALPQMLVGLPMAVRNFRKHGYLLAIAILTMGLWILSVGYTSGGMEISMRVLSPALVVLSIAAAGAMDEWMGRGRWRTVVPIGIGALLFWNAVLGMFFPFDPLSLRPGQWMDMAFPEPDAPMEFKLREQLVTTLPRGTRVLSDSAYLHAAVHDFGIEVVPVWSPEVGFLFSAPAEEAERRLAELNIGRIVAYPRSENGVYLASASPLYGSLAQRWRVVAQSAGTLYVLAPKER